jgi:hypothetical protein
VLAARLAGKSAAETVAAMMAVFRRLGRLDPRLRASITLDNDTAFARHGLLASARAMATWSCDACASWQKGAVENANGRLRRDLPRDLNLDALSGAELQEIILSHNLTPRKCLGFLTPLQALLGELGRDVRIRFAWPVAPRSGSHLEAGRFCWPSPADGVVRLSAAQLATLLEGLPWHRLQPRAIPRPSTAW